MKLISDSLHQGVIPTSPGPGSPPSLSPPALTVWEPAWKGGEHPGSAPQLDSKLIKDTAWSRSRAVLPQVSAWYAVDGEFCISTKMVLSTKKSLVLPSLGTQEEHSIDPETQHPQNFACRMVSQV